MAHRLPFFLLLCSFGLRAAPFFESDFEGGETFLSRPADSGAPSLELFESGRLTEWSIGGGEGVIDVDVPGRRERFRYARREGLTLLGIRGLVKPHPAGADLRTGSVAEWDKGPETGAVDAGAPIFGAYGLSLGFESPDHASIVKVIPPVKEIFVRFYAAFARPELIEDRRGAPGPHGIYFFWLNQILDQPLAQDQVLSLWLYDVFSDTQRVTLKYWTAQGRQMAQKPFRIEWGKPYCFSLHVRMAGGKGGFSFHMESLAVFEDFSLDVSNVRNIGRISFSKNSETGTRLLAPVRYDELAAAPEPIGALPPLPRIDTAAPAGNRLPFFPAPDTLLFPHFQYQVNSENAWMAPRFNSGAMERPYYPPFFPSGFRPGEIFFARARLGSRDGLWGPWGEPVRLAAGPQGEITGEGSRVDSLYFSERQEGLPVTRLSRGQWYYLHVVLSGKVPWDSVSYVHCFWHHARDDLGNAFNRGGRLDLRSNYLLNFSWDGTLYARDTLTREGVAVHGTLSPYVDDRGGRFQKAFAHRRLTACVRLLGEALPGPWIVNAYVKYLPEPREAAIFKREFQVTGAKPSRPALWISLLAAVALMLGAAGWFVHLKRQKNEAADYPKTRQEKLFADGMKYIQENYTRINSTSEIADKLGISDGYFRNLFRRFKNQRLMDCVVQLRIEKAKEMLRTTHLPITDIMMEVGFSDSSYFTKTFKKMTGVPPSKFREIAP